MNAFVYIYGERTISTIVIAVQVLGSAPDFPITLQVSGTQLNEQEALCYDGKCIKYIYAALN